MTVWNDTEKVFDKTQNSMTPDQEKKINTQKVEKEKHSDITQKAYENSTVKMTLNGETEHFPSKIWSKTKTINFAIFILYSIQSSE